MLISQIGAFRAY